MCDKPGMHRCLATSLAIVLTASACSPDQPTGVPGDTGDTAPFGDIGEGETVRFTGTEPFWSAEATGNRLLYRTAEDPDGMTVTVERFAGRGGLSFSGSAGGAAFDLTVTPGECSDGMSDATYPYTATLSVGGETRFGCAWTDANPGTRPSRG